MESRLLRLRGLPYTATEQDLRAFFGESCQLVAVHLLTRAGKNTGEAYVELKSEADAKKALQEKQHQHMGSRYIEIFVASEADLLAQTSGGGGEDARPSLQGHVVRLRGLPFTSTAQDVLQFFEGVDTVGGEAGVVFTCTPDGRPTGEAYVVLPCPDALAAALGRHKERIGSRYIEIFESSKGDMFQAVQQHGYFTTVGGRRSHHWHQQHAGVAQAAAQYPADAGGGGGGGGASGRGRSPQLEEITTAFAGFGLSQRDMQVPGPPRWGAYGAPADQQYQQYMGVPPRQMQQAGGMPPGALRWRPGAQMVPAANMQRPGASMQHFNPAPGPPPGKGGRAGMANGSRQSSSGGMLAMHEYGGHGGGQALMFNPFMMQHPLMMQHQHQQHHASPWGTGGGWYGGVQMGRPGSAMQMGAHMAAHYAHFSPPYFPVRPGSGGSTNASGGGHHQGQHHSNRHQAQTSSGTAGPQPSSSSSQASAAPAAGNSSQQAAQPTPGGSTLGGRSSSGSTSAGSNGEQPAASPASVEPAPAVDAASPATPEQ